MHLLMIESADLWDFAKRFGAPVALVLEDLNYDFGNTEESHAP